MARRGERGEDKGVGVEVVEVCREYGVPFWSFVAVVDEDYVVDLVTRQTGQYDKHPVRGILLSAYPVVGKFA